MTDIPRGQGGDGSPQLNAESGTQVPEYRELCDHICMLPADHVEHGMLHQYCYEQPSPRALVRRLQQENEELREKGNTVTARLFGCVRWLVIVAAQSVLAVAGYVRPPSPGVESLPPAEAYDEL